MPRNEQRPITFSKHAEQRMDERRVSREEVEVIIRGGAWHRDGIGRKGEPKWLAEGSIKGQRVSVAFIETISGAIEILYVLTVMN